MRKKILCLDFDGVCSDYENGWQGATVIGAKPVPFLFEFLEQATKVFEVHVFSSRSNLEGGIAAMQGWFWDHFSAWQSKEALVRDRIPDDFLSDIIFSKQKPPAFVSIDDRAITFTGTWPSIEELKSFKPWCNAEITVGDDYIKASEGHKNADRKTE